MPRLRAVWAVAQLCLALATIGWGAYLLVSTHEPQWASGNFAAAVFFVVTVFLFAANHDDGRVVGLFGLAVLLVTNALLIYTLLAKACDTGAAANCVPHYTGLPRLQLAADWTRPQMAAVMAFTTAFIAIPEALLLIFGHGPPKARAPTREETPQT